MAAENLPQSCVSLLIHLYYSIPFITGLGSSLSPAACSPYPKTRVIRVGEKKSMLYSRSQQLGKMADSS